MKTPFKYTGFKWILFILLLAALMIAVFIYYNRRIKIINDELNRISMVSGERGVAEAVGSSSLKAVSQTLKIKHQ